MPTNVTQEYKKAEQAFREARGTARPTALPCGRCCGLSPSTRAPSTSRRTSRPGSSSSPPNCLVRARGGVRSGPAPRGASRGGGPGGAAGRAQRRQVATALGAHGVPVHRRRLAAYHRDSDNRGWRPITTSIFSWWTCPRSRWSAPSPGWRPPCSRPTAHCWSWISPRPTVPMRSVWCSKR